MARTRKASGNNLGVNVSVSGGPVNPVSLADHDLPLLSSHEATLSLLLVVRFAVRAAEDCVEDAENLAVSERAVVATGCIEIADPALEAAESRRLPADAQLSEEDEGVEMAVLRQGGRDPARERVARAGELVRGPVEVMSGSPERAEVGGVVLVDEEFRVL